MKTEIKRILVPVDFSETSKTALNHAVRLAKKANAEVLLLHVIENLAEYFISVAEFPLMIPQDIEVKEKVEFMLNRLQTNIFAKDNILTINDIRTGSFVDEILKYSSDKKIDLIIMGTHGMSGYKEFILGSNSQKVSNNSKMPVLTIHDKDSNAEYKNIVVPIDNSLHSREKVNIAIEFARIFDSIIHLIGVPDSMTPLDFNKILIKLESIEDVFISKKLGYKLEIVSGKSLAKTTLEYAMQNECDLIVVNSGDESKITDKNLGVFPKKIINHSRIPVLSVKPPDGYFENISLIGYGNPLRQ